MNFSSKKTEHNQVVVKEPEVGLPLLETQLAAARKEALELSVKLRAIEKSKNKEIHDLNNSYSW